MKDYRIGTRYALALFMLAEEAGETARIEKELKEAGRLVEKHREISNLLMNNTISREEKEDFIEKILSEGTSSLLVNFIKVLVKKRRFQSLSIIQEEFHKLYEEKEGIQQVQVTSAIPLGEIVQEKLRKTLEKKLNKKIYLQTTVNPEILGGLVLDFKGNQIDGSFRSVLQELKQRLIHPLC